LAFAWVEDHYGTVWGLVAGMVFGLGEILWEGFTRGRVDALTWGGNGMLLVLGGISLVTAQGIWFKLQTSLIEFAMAMGLWISVFLKKPLLLSLAQKQGALPRDLPVVLKQSFRGLTLRLGVFFAFHALLATWAAWNWSTGAWALLKGVGLTVSLVVYLVVETLILRYRLTSIQ
jgi:intracellular septation protein